MKTYQPWVLLVWMLYQVNIMAGLNQALAVGACWCRCRFASLVKTCQPWVLLVSACFVGQLALLPDQALAVGVVGVDAAAGQHHDRAGTVPG